MKILMTADAVGGVWTYVVELARGLDDGDTEIVIATLGPLPTRVQREELEQLSHVSLEQSTYRLEWMEECWTDVMAAGDWLLQLESDLAPDVVHLNGFCHADLPWRARTVVVAHSCLLSWREALDMPVIDENGLDRYRRAVARGLRAADLVIAPTAAMLACLRRLYGPLPATRVVPTGRDSVRFQPASKAPYMMSAGRPWDPAKNVRLVDRVAPHIPWPIYVAEAEVDAAEPVAGAVPLANVHSLGCLSPELLAHWLSAAAVYALPTRYEPFDVAVLEAALSGCALVLGDIDGLRESWDGAAVFVRPDDAEGLRDALVRLVHRPAERDGLAAAARDRGLRRSVARFASGYRDAYGTLIGARVGRG